MVARRKLEGLGRIMRKTFLAGSALILVMSMASAEAADLTSPVYKAAATPAWNWSGFYVGLNAGGLTNHTDIRERSVETFSPTDTFENTNSDSLQKTGFIGGGQIGYNWQTGQTVIGVEADAAWSNVKNTHETFDNDPFFFGKGGGSTTARFTSQIDWLATFRGRAGIAVTPGLLLYVTGGAAAAGLKVSYENSGNQLNSPTTFSSSKTQFGWTAGFGAEYALSSNWSVKGEYLHIALDSATVNAPVFINPLLGFPAGATVTGTIKANNDLDLIRIGLNYKL
jgi:outer membrane immunogenic protein